MTYLRVERILIAPVLLLIGAHITLPDARLKCGSLPPGGEPLVAVDGEITTVKPDSIWQAVDKDDLMWLQIVCMNPRDSTFSRGRGIQVISIWTAEGPASHLEPTLAEILDAQDANFRRESSYLHELSEIELPGRPEQIQLSMDASDTGWVASAWIDRLLAKCFVFEGEIRLPHSDLSRREPACFDDRELRP